MGAFEAILGLGALLGIGYYVISIANKTPISIPFITPPISTTPSSSSSQPLITPTPSSPSTNTIKPNVNSSSNKKPVSINEPKSPILTPNTSEMTNPNVVGTGFTFNVVGDVDYYEGTGQNLCGQNPTIALIIGDFDYAKPCNPQKWWTTTMKACNGKNVMGSLGNHDCGGKGFLELFPANGGQWSAIKKIGNIAFVALNTGTCSAVCSNPSTEEKYVKQAQDDPSVKWIVVHFHKPVFTSGTAPDAPMGFHTMLTKYPKVKMVFAGHNHKYIRFVPIAGIQYITAGRGGHDASGNEPVTKGPSSNTVGVVKCRVGTDGGMSCQYVANNGTVCDSWGLTADGKHTGSGGVTPKQGIKAAEAAYAQSYFASREDLLSHYYSTDKEDRDNAILDMLFERELQLHPRRKFNNTIYHYNTKRYTNERY